MKDIQIDVGVYTELMVNLKDIEIGAGEEIVLTIKNTPSPKEPAIVERHFYPEEVEGGYAFTSVTKVEIEPIESVKIQEGAVYDFSKVTADGKQFKLTDNGRVILRKAVGDCIE